MRIVACSSLHKGEKETPLKYAREMIKIVSSLRKSGGSQKLNNLNDQTGLFSHRQKVKGYAGFFFLCLV